MRSVDEKYKAIKEIIEFCCDKNMYSYSYLLEYCSMERYDWFRVLCDNGTVVVKEYLKSKSWTCRIMDMLESATENHI